MKTFKHTIILLFALLVLLSTLGSGCISPDADNTSARPWNEPRGFDTGILGRDPRRGF